MSNIDGVANHTDNESTQIQQENRNKLTPLYQQLTHKIVVLLLTIIVIIGLVSILFYQNNAKNNALVETQLLPLTQELKQINALQKAEKLVTDLLIAGNAENFVELHSELISINRQLLQQNSSNVQLFQQWLNDSKLAEDIVSRIQGSHTRNQQLKHSSIIQLQLMLVSITPIIDNKLASTYAKSVQQLNDLQKLKALLAQVLLSFEKLNMHTPITSFEHLRLKIEQIFIQHKQLRSDEAIKAMIDVNQQFDAFEKIVLTEQRALAKWQGYIRLTQDYQLDLKAQQQTIRKLLLTPYKVPQVGGTGIINDLLGKLDIELSDKNISVILIIAISFSLLFFFYLLWRLREQIKASAQQGVEIIKNTLLAPEKNVIANCVETQEIMNHVQSITKPKYNEREFQELSEQYQSNQQLLAQQEQNIEQLTQCNEQLHLDSKEQIAEQLNYELQRYQLLEESIFPIMQHHQLTCFNQKILSENDDASVSTQLTFLRQQLAQFHLALEMKSDKSVLKLSDINLVDELHAILFNKQQEYQKYDNQLFISSDEKLLREAKIDFRLFQQLISLFLDITLTNCRASQLLLQVKLQDKKAGQQLVHFCAKVKTKSIDTLPNSITQLVDSQSTFFTVSPLIEVFNILFAKQHGKNIVAQLVDDGYQLSFELPLAIATTGDSTEKVTLESTNIMLLSSNTTLAGLVEKIVLSAKGTFERLTRIDSFNQHLTEKNLNRRKLDVLVVASDVAVNHLDLITQQINNVPHSLQPKLMVLQSKELNYERFGFYSQAEQMFCKESFLHNITNLLANNELNNQLFPCEPFAVNQTIATELPLLLAVQSPPQYQNLQRLLLWLGLQVQVVSHEAAQQTLWKTGQYSLLITEFAQTALLEMANKPIVNVGVFSLTDVIPHLDNNSYFENWHLGKLTKESTLSELIDALTPWLKQENYANEADNTEKNSDLLVSQTEYSEKSGELVITEVAQVFTENEDDAVFDFSQYLHNQGTVELALFMIDDYTQDNHQRLDALIDAIKAKNVAEAKLSIAALALNARILSAAELQSLCTKWLKLLSGTEIPSSLEKINALLKDTRMVLNEIDEYAETI